MAWTPAEDGNVPPNALVVGTARDGGDLVFARKQLPLELAVGKLHVGRRNARIPYMGASEHAMQYDILTHAASPGEEETRLTWRPARGASVPEGAVQGGVDQECQPTFLARVDFNKELVPARVSPLRALAVFVSGGKEHTADEYEVLCVGDETSPPQAEPQPEASVGEPEVVETPTRTSQFVIPMEDTPLLSDISALPAIMLRPPPRGSCRFVCWVVTVVLLAAVVLFLVYFGPDLAAVNEFPWSS